MIEKLVVSRADWAAMRRHVARCAPQEACGLLAGKEGRVEMRIGIRNEARSPVRFRMEPRAQWHAFQRMEAAGMELLGIYHSHPKGPETPSPTDIRENLYPVAQVIWCGMNGEWRARCFRIEGRRTSEITLEIMLPE
jgi:proteasome lid subunit RPN8/RPN11